MKLNTDGEKMQVISTNTVVNRLKFSDKKNLEIK